MRLLPALVILAATALAPAASHAGVIFIPDLTVQGKDVTAGPTFVANGNYSASDVVNVRGVGTVDLANGDFTANAAGVITAPALTNTGNQPGETSPGPGGFPFGSVVIGNDTLGFFPLFRVDASTGSGSSTPPTDIVAIHRTLGDIFGNSVKINAGTVLELRINDYSYYAYDNSGSFRISTVPEPATFVSLGLGLVALAGYGWRRRARAR